MGIRGSAGKLGFVLVLLGWATLFAQDGQPRPLTKPQQDELRAIYSVVSAVEQGQSAPNDLSMEWTSYDVLMKVLTDGHYTPFTVTIDPSKVTGKELTVYWRVVAKEPTRAADAPESPGDGPSNGIAYEDMNTAMVASTAPQMIRRFFTVPAGQYDVDVVVKEVGDGDEQKTSYLTHSVTVPDYWNDKLTTSAVILADSIEPLSVPLTLQQQAERPYALGPMEIVPARDTQFSATDQLQTFMLIYNASTDAQNKPDVTVEYSFYTKRDDAEEFFNKTNPQALNARTLPPSFDMASGHQLQSAQAVPLGSFPAGDYRLEIKVTDKLADTSLTRDVNFSVSSS